MLPERNLGTGPSYGRTVTVVAAALAIAVLVSKPLIANAAELPVDLGTADSFAVLAGEGVTNTLTGFAVINGDLGTYPNASVTRFPPGIVNGEMHQADAEALQAQTDLTTAYNDASSRVVTERIGVELGGKTLTPGVYDSEAGYFEITGTLTLDATGDPDGVFIFKMASTLVTASGSNVILLGGARQCTVFWQVGSSATLATYSDDHGECPGVDIHPGPDVRRSGRPAARSKRLDHAGRRSRHRDDMRRAPEPQSEPEPEPEPQSEPEPEPEPERVQARARARARARVQARARAPVRVRARA